MTEPVRALVWKVRMTLESAVWAMAGRVVSSRAAAAEAARRSMGQVLERGPTTGPFRWTDPAADPAASPSGLRVRAAGFRERRPVFVHEARVNAASGPVEGSSRRAPWRRTAR